MSPNQQLWKRVDSFTDRPFLTLRVVYSSRFTDRVMLSVYETKHSLYTYIKP